jgi:hypothetical protein
MLAGMAGPTEGATDEAPDARAAVAVSPLRAAILVMLVGVAALQLVAVTLAALPPNRVSDAAAPSTGYLQPYFAQNWRLFAPNPVAQDRSIRFQGAYRDESGDVRQTAWVDWTDVELDLVRHRLVGGRAGYVTNKMTSSVSSRYRALTSAQRDVVDRTTDTDPFSWSELASGLSGAGASSGRVESFVSSERALVRLGGDVLASRFPEREIVAVRYGVLRQSVTPYSRRASSRTASERARPNSVERLSGWRVPVESTAREREVVASFDQRHR